MHDCPNTPNGAMDSRAELLNAEPSANASWDEDDRLAALIGYCILDTPAETSFDDLVELAVDLCAVSSAAIHFVADTRLWCKAAAGGPRDTSQPRDGSLCARAILQTDPLVIEDLSQEPEAAASGRSGFYAAAVLRTPEGLPLGTFCLFDDQPRQLTARQLGHLQALARQATAALELRRTRHIDERNRQIIDSAVDYAILTCSPQGEITSWNEGAQRILGWQATEIIGRAARCIFTPEDRAQGVLEAEMRTAQERGSALDERWHQRQDGTQFWASGVMMPMKDERGALRGFVKILRDLTATRLQQAATWKAEQRYRALVDLSPQVIWQCEPDGALSFCNGYWSTFTDLSAEDSRGDGWLAAVSEDKREQVLEQWRHILRSKLPGTLDLPLLDADGALRWFQARGAPVYDENGELLHWIFAAQDIDDRRRADSDRLESEAFTRLLLDSVSEGFYSIDTDGQITMCNQAFVRLLGFASKDEVLGRQLCEVVRHGHPDGTTYEPEHCPIRHTARTGEPAHAEHELLYRQDGSSLSVEYRVAPLYREGVLQGAICTFTDISERVRGEALQAFLLELSDQLQEAVERVDFSAILGGRLGRLFGVERIAYGCLDEHGDLLIAEEWHNGGSTDRIGGHPLGELGQPLRRHVEQGAIVPLDDLLAGGQHSPLHEHFASQSLLLAPLPEETARPTFLLFACNQPRSWSQTDLGLVREMVERIRSANERACARKALLDAEQRISLANEIASIGVWEYDVSRQELIWDTQLKAMAGLAADQRGFQAADLFARVHADDRGLLISAISEALEGKGDGELSLEYRIYDSRTNQFRWFANRGRRLVDARGNIRLLGTARDITAERNAAQKLLRINALLEEQIEERHLAEQRQAALMGLSDLLREQPDSLTIANAAVRALGTTLNVSRAAFASIDPGGQYATIERYWSNGSLNVYQERMCFADYGDFLYDLQNDELVVVDDVLHDVRTASQAASLRARRIQSLVCVPLQEQGRLSAALVLLQDQPRAWLEDDISFIREVADRAWTADERMRAERALRASEEQFRTLADNMSQFAWMADPAGRIYWYNKRWYDYTGTTLEAMRALGWRAVHHPDHHVRVSTSMKRAVAIGSIWEETFPLRGKDGKYRWFLARALPIRDELGQVIHWFGTNTDITAQVTAEEALRELNDNLERRVAERTRELAEINHRLHLEMGERERAEDALRHAQKMEAIGQLTGGLAHDFNNMLTGVLGALDLIQRRLASGRSVDLERYIDAAVTSANRAAALTHRLLAFARRQSLDPKPVDVNQLVISMEDMLRRTMAEHIQLNTRLQPDPWLAYTDAHQLENALLNLVINARDAMEGGGRITIQTGCVRISDSQPDNPAPGDYVTLSVADSGSGMPAEVVTKAFDPFFTTKPIGQGTGLGLSMVYGFVKQTGGHVRIDSTVGQGTLITLFLPRNCLQPTADVPEETGFSAIPGALQGETVLVVEDEAAVRMLVLEVLEELGYQVLEAVDANSALPVLRSDQRVDLLVSDFGLPGMNGHQLVEIARQHRPELKVLFITGYAPNAEVRGDFLGPGMDMLAKPFNIDVLATKVRQLIGRDG